MRGGGHTEGIRLYVIGEGGGGHMDKIRLLVEKECKGGEEAEGQVAAFILSSEDITSRPPISSLQSPILSFPLHFSHCCHDSDIQAFKGHGKRVHPNQDEGEEI